MKFSLDISKTFNSINEKELKNLEPMIKIYHDFMTNKQGIGNDYLGWNRLPIEYNKSEFERIKITADKIKKKCDILVNIGIGGSYLGAKAAIELFSHSFFDLLKDKKQNVKVLFAGNNMSSKYLNDLLEVLEHKEVCLNVISKSGTTTEPAIAFRILKDFIIKKYGKEEAKSRIFITTDKSKGTLKALADKEGYETFVIPDDVGGRFSVLTPVGLLPMAVAGINIDDVMSGANDAYNEFMDIYDKENSSLNICYKYAAVRNCLYRKGKVIEVLSNFEPSFQYFGEWWKQLFGESEGKDGKGIFPVSCNFSTDLHSMGQYIQDGQRNFFETFININNSKDVIKIDKLEVDIDGLNFLEGKTLHYVNDKAFLGTLYAHYNGNVPCMVLNIPEVNEQAFGYLIYFFEKACAMSGYLLGVNPFDQPGVENYKSNMFSLLGKPGYDKLEITEDI